MVECALLTLLTLPCLPVDFKHHSIIYRLTLDRVSPKDKDRLPIVIAQIGTVPGHKSLLRQLFTC